jgi:2'-5' RNA ligase
MKIKQYIDFLESFQKDLNENKKQDSSHDYGCAMVYFKFTELTKIQSQIDKDDLYSEEKDNSYGLEKNPHVTLLYGLHSDEIDDNEIMDSINTEKFTDLILYNVSSFKNEKFEVLKFDIRYPFRGGAFLTNANNNLKQFPYTNDFPDYHPHSTIAYLKPGTVDKYIELFKDQEFTVTPLEIVYSKADGTEIKKKIKIKNND